MKAKAESRACELDERDFTGAMSTPGTEQQAFTGVFALLVVS